MPAALIGAGLSAAEFGYDAANAGNAGGPVTEPVAPVALTPQEQNFFEQQALTAQNNSEAQTQAYETASAQSAGGSDLLKWGLGITLAYLLWRVARKKKWI